MGLEWESAMDWFNHQLGEVNSLRRASITAITAATSATGVADRVEQS